MKKINLSNFKEVEQYFNELVESIEKDNTFVKKETPILIKINFEEKENFLEECKRDLLLLKQKYPNYFE
ncbi:hypothetical protein [Aliarcobacter butzleri]|uniref:Uncharacterized protein n=1 Tax=Aliarcobacter butzleri L348 TaxID=1447256 RepID=A0A0G9JYP3_9BACT|nr:hypothetical protein [Aliarcobacter butzleri]KLD98664.1 hypothetical protein AA20_08205 [Aliarcobacter butzleri L348]